MRGNVYSRRDFPMTLLFFCSKFSIPMPVATSSSFSFLKHGRSRRWRSLLLRRREPRRARDDGRSSRARYAHHHHHRAACFASSSSSSSSSSLWWSYFLRYKQRNWRSCIFRMQKIRSTLQKEKRRYARRQPFAFALLSCSAFFLSSSDAGLTRFVLQNGRHEKTIRHPLLR